ncbi:TPA: hypothetical protein ACS7XE_002094 [Providencia alcalifaciens]|uniref:Uncharacterized protein n=1 Tax=Providencia alcalifaciens DSM 30120 TaxID=520999 RepID=B6XFA3_9GAMM|nr:hypothetical protein PROVALCAL_02035 [Providencia alcalifaciens DSM 30120]
MDLVLKLLTDRPQILTGQNDYLCLILTGQILMQQILTRQDLTYQILLVEVMRLSLLKLIY